jgi:hypothetical protein
MMRLFPLTLLSVLFLLTPVAEAQKNLVVNGSFEEPVAPNGSWHIGAIPGWTISGDGIGEIHRGVFGLPAGEGKQWAELDVVTNATLHQDIATVAGERYRITVMTAARPGVNSNRIQLLWNNESVGFQAPGDATFRYIENDVIATSSVSRIAVRGAGNVSGDGDWVDNISVVHIGGAGAILSYRYFVPHYASNGGWTTSLVITSESGEAMTYMRTHYSDAGAVLLRPGLVSVAANTTVEVVMGGSTGTIQTGWILVETDRPANVSAIFRERVSGRPDFEAAVPARDATARIATVYDNRAGYSTGMALANPNSRAIRLNVSLRNSSGAVLRTASLNVAAFGHTAFFIDDTWTQTANNFGRIEIEAVDQATGEGRTFVPIGLRFSPGGAFTTLPY